MAGPSWRWGNMWQVWDRPRTAFVVTTNSSTNRFGELVMGRGIAKQLRERQRAFGRLFAEELEACWVRTNGEYGLMLFTNKQLEKRLGKFDAPRCWVGAFQVKRHYSDAAEPSLIQKSAMLLAEKAKQQPAMVFNLNYPGIGFGRLSEAVVNPLLRCLPENVHVWRFEHQMPANRRNKEEDEDATESSG